MKKLSRYISLLLALVMSLGILPVQAIATDSAENPAAVNQMKLHQNPSTDYIAEVLGGINFELDEDSVATAFGLPLTPTAVSTPNANDLLTFSGGTESADGVYVIDMGDYSTESWDLGTRVPLTITRGQSAYCDYDISVDFSILPGSLYGNLSAYASGDTANDITEIKSVLFESGDNTKTIYIDYPSNTSAPDGKVAMYIDFHYGYRTKTQQRLVQLVWNCTNAYDSGIYSASTNAAVTVPDKIVVEDGKALIPINVDFSSPVSITEDTKLYITPSATESQEIELSAQEVGAITPVATFIYELDVTKIGNVTPFVGGNTTELFTVSKLTGFSVSDEETNSSFNVTRTFSSAVPGELTASCTASLLVRPQYGTITLDKLSVDGGDAITMTVPVTNAATLEKFGVFTADNVTDWFHISVDGGMSLASSYDVSMINGTVTLSFNAPVDTTQAKTVYAEIMEVSEENGSSVATAILGKFIGFSVSDDVVTLEDAQSLTITGLPENNIFAKEDVGRIINLGAIVKPNEATYKDITWGSSNMSIASIDSMGKLTIHKEGIVEITAFTGEVKYRADNGLPPNPNAIKTVKLFIGDAAPRLLPDSSFSDSSGNLRFVTLDNFSLAIPSDETAASEFLSNMRVGYTIKNKAGTIVASGSNKEPGNSEVRHHIVEGLEGTALTISLLYGTAYEVNDPLVRENSVYVDGELQPAYTAEVTVSWPKDGGGEHYPSTSATYNIYVSPAWLTVDMTGWKDRVFQATEELKPTITINNLSQLEDDDNAWVVSYELYRGVAQIANGTMNYANRNNPTSGFTYNVDTHSATISLSPDIGTAGRLALKVTAKNAKEKDTITRWSYCDVIDPGAGNPITITAFGKIAKPESGQSFGGNFDTEIVSKYNLGNEAFIKWLETTKPINTVQISAPDSWGEAKINGKEFSDWRSFGVNMKNSGGELIITWEAFPNHPYKIDYRNSYTGIASATDEKIVYDLYIFDFDKSITVPITFYTLDGAGNKYGEYVTKTPYEGRVALMVGRNKTIAESDASPFACGVYMTATIGGETCAGFIGKPAKANWVGSPEKGSIVYSLEDSASHGGYFVSNRIRLDKERILRITAPGLTAGSSFKAAVVDETGVILSGAQPQTAIDGKIEINYYPMFEDEDNKLLIEITDKITGSRLEVIDHERLREIVGDSEAYMTDFVIKPRYQEGSVFHGFVSETGGFSSLIMRRTVTLPEDSRGERQEARTEDILSRGYIQGSNSSVPLCYIIETESPSFTVCARVDKDANTNEALTLNSRTPISDSVIVYDCDWLNKKYIVASYDKSVVDWTMQSNGMGSFQGYFELRLGSKFIDRVYTTLSTTDDTKVGKWFSLLLAQESAKEASRMSTPNIQSANNNLDTSHGSPGFSKYKMNMPKDMNYNFYVTQSETDPNLYTIRGAVSLTQSLNEPLAPFESLINKAADSEKEINDIIDDCRNTVKNGPGFSFSVETDTPFSYSSTIKSYIIAKGIYNPDTGKMQVYFQEGGMKGEINAGYSQSIPIAGLFEMGFGIEGGYSISLIQSAPSKEELQKASSGYSGIPMNSSIENEMSVKLTVKAGIVLNAGFVKLEVGAGGSGTIAYFNKVVRRPYLANQSEQEQSGNKIRGTAEAFVYSSVGILFIDITVEYTIAKGSKEWLLPNNSSNVYHEDNPAYVQTLSLMGDQREGARLAFPGIEVEKKTIAPDLHSSASTRYVNGDVLYNAIIEWGDYNDDAIMASEYVKIATSDNGQYAFDAAYSGNYSVAAWEELKGDVSIDGAVDPLTALREQMTKTEIKVAINSGTDWSAAVALSNNDVIDMSPVAAVASDGRAVVIWKRGALETDTDNINQADDNSDVGKALKMDGKFELVYSKFDGTDWSKPEVLYRPAEGRSINTYSLACDTGGGFVAAVALTPKVEGELCDIEYISVDAAGDFNSFIADVKGVNPQLTCIGSDYYTGIYTEREITGEITADNGQSEPVTEIIGDIQFGKLSNDKTSVTLSALGLPATIGADFRFTASPTDLAGLGIVHPVISFDTVSKKNEASLVTAKIFDDSGRYYTGPALELKMGASTNSVRVASYDAKVTGGRVDAIAVLADVNGNASLVENDGTFVDSVRVETSYKPSDLAPEQGLPVSFMIKNDSQRVLTDIEITSGGETIFTDDSIKLLPNGSKAFSAEFMLGVNLPPALDYTVTLTYGAGELTKPGSIELAQGDLSLELLSFDENSREAVLLIGDESRFGLQDGDSVIVGLYRDIEGKTPVAAASVITLSGDAFDELKATGRALTTLSYTGDMDNEHIFAVVKAVNRNKELWDISPEDNVSAFMPLVKKTVAPPIGGEAGGTAVDTEQIIVEETVVTYPKGSAPVKNPDGSFTLTSDGSIEVEPGIIITAPAGTIVNADGSVILPDGKTAEVRITDTTTVVTLTGGGGVSEKGVISVGNAGAELRNDLFRIALEEGETLIPDASSFFGFKRDYEDGFIDVPASSWYAGAVRSVFETGIMNGISDSEFAPNQELSRAMLVQMLHNIQGRQNAPDSEFADVLGDEWYADAVAWAAANGIVNGYGDGTFGPNDSITREEMAVMLYRFCKYKNIRLPEVRDANIADISDIADWAVEAVEAMYRAGILSGKGDGIFDPKGTATRAEVAQMFMNFLNAVK